MRQRTIAAWLLGACGVGVLLGCRAPAAAPAPAPTPDPMVAVNTLHDAPRCYAIMRIGTPPYVIPPWAKFLRGVKICLDPGHGGDAHKRGFKRGPTGVREAEVNLRVAQYLHDLLRAAGAEVRLTRTDDTDATLAARAAVANDWGADLFISLHHNAVDKPRTNFTTVWYHRDVDYRPANLDLARYLCEGLYDSLALPQITDVPLKSDQLMYKDGFGVLRAAQVTAALTETSFFTNPEEEQRLRTPEWNLREAWGLFLGLARYAAAGLPRARLVEPADGVLIRDPVTTTAPQAGTGADAGGARPAAGVLVFELDDGLRGRRAWGSERQMILSDTIVVRIDGYRVPHEFTNEGYRLRVVLPPETTFGPHRVEVQFMNKNKNSVLNPHFQFELRPAT